MLANLGELRIAAVGLGSRIIMRRKRTARQAPGASRVVNMLSVISARKKMPRRLKLCTEDLVRHQTVKAAWGIFKKQKDAANVAKLQLQYEKIKEACEELEKLDPGLFAAANAKQTPRFPIELRVPTDTPPRVPWAADWQPLEKKESR